MSKPRHPRNDKKFRIQPGQVIRWGGNEYLVTHDKEKPLIKRKDLALACGLARRPK